MFITIITISIDIDKFNNSITVTL